ncbi:MAG: hypothetical protein PHQ36_05370 [Anaerolineales bacterium]|nr:hypothetical protein [Anaerolineales bacterium]
MSKRLFIPLDDLPFFEATSSRAWSLTKSKGAEIIPPRIPNLADKETKRATKKHIETLPEKLETVESRVSFLIHKKSIMCGIADWAGRIFTNAGVAVLPAKGEAKTGR